MPPAPKSRRFLAAALAASYPLLAHAASVLGSRFLTLASVVLLGVVVFARPLADGRRYAWVALPLVVLAVAALARLGAVALLLFLPPVLLNAYMAWLFGHTLARGSVPIIERLVRLLQPPDVPFEPGVIAYARRLTLGWTAVFVLLGMVNLVLAALARPHGLLEAAGIDLPLAVSLSTWSLFANLLNYAIVAVLFLGEFAWRRRRFPGRPYRGLLDFVRRSAAVAPALAASFATPPAGDWPGPDVERELLVPENHPAFAGHFPGRPVLPAVALLDEVVEAARALFGEPVTVAGLPRAKFMTPLAPGDRATIRLRRRPGGFEFDVSRGPVRIATGVVALEPSRRRSDG